MISRGLLTGRRRMRVNGGHDVPPTALLLLHMSRGPDGSPRVIDRAADRDRLIEHLNVRVIVPVRPRLNVADHGPRMYAQRG